VLTRSLQVGKGASGARAAFNSCPSAPPLMFDHSLFSGAAGAHYGSLINSTSCSVCPLRNCNDLEEYFRLELAVSNI